MSLHLDDAPRRSYCLPQATRSLLFVFDGLQIGAVASSGKEFAPGTRHAEVHLTFWAEADAQALVHPGDEFTVWYLGTVGRGRVHSAGRQS